MISEGLLIFHVLQAVLADPQLWLLSIVLRKRREIPSIDLKVSYLDLIHIFHFGDLKKRDIWCHEEKMSACYLKSLIGLHPGLPVGIYYGVVREIEPLVRFLC